MKLMYFTKELILYIYFGMNTKHIGFLIELGMITKRQGYCIKMTQLVKITIGLRFHRDPLLVITT